MNFIYNKIFLKHKTTMHPECPERLEYFDKNINESRLDSGEKYLDLVYDREFISTIKKYSDEEKNLDPDTYTNKFSYKAACYSVASAIKAAKENGFSLGRPPGHHATKNKAMGFCLFNNVAIASKFFMNKDKKILIVDIDSHSGNGTQDVFYETDKLLFLSMHQFPAYPGTGWVDEIGNGSGKGFTINIPLPPETGDDLFLQSLNAFIPIMKDQFKPDMVGVSAGFDGHHSDPLLQLNLTTNSYYEVGKLLSKNFKNVFACLEGGYNLNFIHKNILDFVNGINNKKQQFEEKSTSSDIDIKNQFNTRIEILKENLKGYWKFDNIWEDKNQV